MRSSRSIAPEHVHAASGEDEDGLAVSFSFGAFAVVIGSGRWTSLNADWPRSVEDPLELPVVAFRPMEVARAPTRIARCLCQSGVAGEVIRGGEAVQAAPDAGRELGTQQCPDADHAGDHRSVLVRLEAFSDHGVELGGLAIEVKYVDRESSDDLCSGRFARDLGALRLGSAVGCGGEFGGRTDLALS